MTAREWLHVAAILDSIDEVPGLSDQANALFRAYPARYLRKADDATQAAIWAEVERRLAGGA